MRVSTQQFVNQFNSTLQLQQGNVAKLQQQISLGRRVLTPSDDPSDATRILDIEQTLGRLDQFQSNATLAEQRLSLQESTATSVTNLLQRVRELAIAAANLGVQSPSTLSAYRVEMEERFNELVGLANSKDASGEFLFAGFQSDIRPFTATATGVVYNGDQGQRILQVGPDKQVAVSDSGAAIFQQIRNGNGDFSVDSNNANTGDGVIAPGSVIDNTVYQKHDFSIQFTSATTYDVVNTTSATTIITGASYVDGATISFNGIETNITGNPQTGDEFLVQASRNQDIFATFRNFINTLNGFPSNGSGQAHYRQDIQAVILDIDQSLENLVGVQASIGARLNAIESTTDENEAVQFQILQTLSTIRDLDYADAVSSLQTQLSTLEAAQQTYATISRLSLFNFL